MSHRILSLSLVCLLSTFAASAKGTSDSSMTHSHHQVERFNISSNFDAGIFSTATIKEPGNDSKTGTLRFSYIFNYGFKFNFNLCNHFGLFTGIDIKNVGFIEKQDGATIKRRTYNIGAPIGFKIGNLLPKKAYFFAGAGVDVPINYKEKEFTSRSHKAKFNEWFSDRTPAIMTYLFAGAKINDGFTFKLQYYPTNFLNPDYTETVSGVKVQPYAGYDVHLILFSIGYDMHYGKKHGNTNSNVAPKSVKNSIPSNSL